MKAYILKKKDTNFDKIELSSIQTLFSLGTQRKYEIHFNFAKKRNEEILNNINKQNEFLSTYKKKLSDILKIDINRIIFKDVRYGCVKASASFIDQSRREDIEIPRLRQMDNVIDVEKKVIVDQQILSPDILDPKGDRYKGWGVNETRGGEKYIPPIGWVGIGLKVLNMYDNNNNDWLSCRNIEGEYSIAYYGLHNYLNDKAILINDLNDYINDIRKAISERLFQSEYDKRTGFLGFGRNICGGGVCLFQDPKYAESCAGIINISGFQYKILLMCRVNPKKIRQPSMHDKFWILNPTPDEIRPYRILIKRNDNSPLLSENNLKIEVSPVKYIMDAINSGDTSFYGLKTEEKFKKRINNINGEILSDEFFVLRLYSSMYYKPINEYMFNGKILVKFQNEYNLTVDGFNEEQIKSAICCIQNALKNNINVENNITVYRGVAFKFPANINVGSQFYFSSFISTSTKSSIAKSFMYDRINKKDPDSGGTFMTINIQNNDGTDNHPNYCFNIEKISLSPEQKEILISSHCYFQVTRLERNSKIDYVDLTCKGYLLNNYKTK